MSLIGCSGIFEVQIRVAVCSDTIRNYVNTNSTVLHQLLMLSII